MSELHANYVRDLGFHLREKAEQASRDCVAAKGTDDAAFQAGRAMAYYEVASLVVEQAKTFHLPLADVACESFEPDLLLK